MELQPEWLVGFLEHCLWSDFPEQKGLVSRIAAAGFGLGAMVVTEIFILVLQHGGNVLFWLKVLGISYGVSLIFFAACSYRNF